MGFNEEFENYKQLNDTDRRSEKLESLLREEANNAQANRLLQYVADSDQHRAVRDQRFKMGGKYFPDPLQGEVIQGFLSHDDSELAETTAATLLLHRPDVQQAAELDDDFCAVVLRYGYCDYFEHVEGITRHELYRAAEGSFYNADTLPQLLSRDGADFDSGELQAAFCQYVNWAYSNTTNPRTPAPSGQADTVVQALIDHGMPIRGELDYGREIQEIEGRSFKHLLPALIALHSAKKTNFYSTIMDMIESVRELDQDSIDAIYHYATLPGGVQLSEAVLKNLLNRNILPRRLKMKTVKNRSTGPANYLRENLPRRADIASDLNDSVD